jgi:type II secretory ATPase GspE/PulE/Tfp pilus assembly ATPase PilB-like protein
MTDVSIIQVIDGLIARGHRRRASDVHLAPAADRLRVRFRVDGLLADEQPLPKSAQPEAIARIKILAGMRTDEHRVPQDGRFRAVTADGAVDVRVSVAPTHHGENAVLRLLPERDGTPDLASLGLGEDDGRRVRDAVARPHGLVLVAGPTGSGKTTTLYAMVGLLNAPDGNITSIEDPVEYAIDGVSQINVNPRAGLTFAAGLRSVLRQDPDVIMVGEVRDAETAALAVNAALTGHLVLTTVHANDAAAAIPRLLDLGVEPFLLASTLALVVGQRLARRVCRDCGGRVPSCVACAGTGHAGRVGLFETLAADGELRAAVARKAVAEELHGLARHGGMTTMAEDGAAKARAGVTTREEVMRVLHE